MPRRRRGSYRAHPTADILPMMSEEELQGLAVDIKENGLLHAISLVDYEGEDVILDGRNRQKACEIAEVEPAYEKLEDIDVPSFVVSANLHRRNLSKGQQAMALAMVYPSGREPGRRRDPAANSIAEIELSTDRLRKARQVLRFSLELAQEVINGALSIDAALERVEREQGDIRNQSLRHRRLRTSRPDLAVEVEEERMTLEEAETKLREDAEQLRSARWALTKNTLDGLSFFDRDIDQAQYALEMFDKSIAEQSGQTVTKDRISRAIEYLTALHEIWEDDEVSDEE